RRPGPRTDGAFGGITTIVVVWDRCRLDRSRSRMTAKWRSHGQKLLSDTHVTA
ncbi:1-phosphatidylinositol-3-phosphate 5-kinase, partial [Moniliophthora roreri]